MSFHMIWPGIRSVSDVEVKRWAGDAVANEQIDNDDVDLDDATSCARALHEAGLVTLSAFKRAQ